MTFPLLLIHPEPLKPLSCPEMGHVKLPGTKSAIPSCKKLYPSGAAIRVPKDTAPLKFGVVLSSMSSMSIFVNRDGQQWSFNSALLNKGFPSQPQLMSQIIVTAKFAHGKITRIDMVLYLEVRRGRSMQCDKHTLLECLIHRSVSEVQRLRRSRRVMCSG